MLENLVPAFMKQWKIPDSLLKLAISVDEKLEDLHKKVDALAEKNTLKVLSAFREAGIQGIHLHGSHGYGYFDAGRKAMDALFAKIFGGEEGLVRLQFVSGTHAISSMLFGLLRPGDEVLVIPPEPYDSLKPVFGLKPATGSLREWGVAVCPVEDSQVVSSLSEKTKVVFIQRSKGYAWRNSFSISRLKSLAAEIKSANPAVLVIVDNCYGEFVEEVEPCQVGVDLIGGSLIKNPGGGLAPAGGYLVGKGEAVWKGAYALTAPGLGKEIGASLERLRELFAGLYFAPRCVGEALKTALFAAGLFKELGYPVLPDVADERTDIIQAIQLGKRDKVLAFAKGLQEAGPLEHQAVPTGALMPGYADDIVMAGGTFIQGGSLELSCDAPLRPPYIAYLQGGLSSVHGKLGVLLAAKAVLESSKSPKSS